MKVRPRGNTYEAIRFAEDGSNWQDVCYFIGAETFWGIPEYSEEHPNFLDLPNGPPYGDRDSILRGWWVMRNPNAAQGFELFTQEEFVEKFESAEEPSDS